jgi:hypothetical protein
LHRSEKKFAVDEMVYLKLQPYIQSSVAPRSNQKLSFRYYGPFKVLARVGTVAYHLQLPAECKIHRVVHVSQLKCHIPALVQVQDDISDIPDDPLSSPQPVHFLGARMVQKGATMLSQIKVQWSGLSASLTTWEEASDLRWHFPSCAAWGQAAFRGWGNVRISQKLARKGGVTAGRLTTGVIAGKSNESVG